MFDYLVSFTCYSFQLTKTSFCLLYTDLTINKTLFHNGSLWIVLNNRLLEYMYQISKLCITHIFTMPVIEYILSCRLQTISHFLFVWKFDSKENLYCSKKKQYWITLACSSIISAYHTSMIICTWFFFS